MKYKLHNLSSLRISYPKTYRTGTPLRVIIGPQIEGSYGTNKRHNSTVKLVNLLINSALVNSLLIDSLIKVWWKQ